MNASCADRNRGYLAELYKKENSVENRQAQLYQEIDNLIEITRIFNINYSNIESKIMKILGDLKNVNQELKD